MKTLTYVVKTGKPESCDVTGYTIEYETCELREFANGRAALIFFGADGYQRFSIPDFHEIDVVMTRGDYPDDDGLCLNCGHNADEPAPMKRRKKQKAAPKRGKGKAALPTNPKRKQGRKKKAATITYSEKCRLGEDLLSMVVKALTGVDDGLDLSDLTAKVMHLGYQTQSQNLGKAIYNVLGKLRKHGKVVRDEQARKYRLVVTESEVQYVEVAG